MKIYQVDAFAEKLFEGNPAAVCLVGDVWPTDGLMQNIAAENNLSETAFVTTGDVMGIRWFTPVAEVPLCGHATLAAAHVMFRYEGAVGEVLLKSPLHTLRVIDEGDMLVLDFPRADIWQIPAKDAPQCFDAVPIEAWRSSDEYMLVYENEGQIRAAVCDMEKAAQIDLNGIIITAKADDGETDFVSRYFTPKFGIDEDPVTGSAHTLLAPYWHRVLQKNNLRAAQLSKRGGKLHCKIDGDRIRIGGKAVTFFVGEIPAF